MEEMTKFFEGIRLQEAQRGIFKQMEDDINEFFKACDEFIEKMKEKKE